MRLFKHIKLKTIDKYKLENINKSDYLVLNDFNCHRKVKKFHDFNEFEFKYYSKLLILYQNQDLRKNFMFNKALKANKTQQSIETCINSITKRILSKIESFLSSLFALKN